MVQKFDADGNFLSVFSGDMAPGIAAANGSIYVTIRHGVVKYDGAGNQLSTWGSYGVATSPF